MIKPINTTGVSANAPPKLLTDTPSSLDVSSVSNLENKTEVKTLIDKKITKPTYGSISNTRAIPKGGQESEVIFRETKRKNCYDSSRYGDQVNETFNPTSCCDEVSQVMQCMAILCCVPCAIAALMCFVNGKDDTN